MLTLVIKLITFHIAIFIKRSILYKNTFFPYSFAVQFLKDKDPFFRKHDRSGEPDAKRSRKVSLVSVFSLIKLIVKSNGYLYIDFAWLSLSTNHIYNDIYM